MRMFTRRSAMMLAVAALPVPALAHLPAGSRGPNGGQVQDLGNYHGELLARDGEITLFLFDHGDRPLDARRATGTAIVQADGRQQTLTFAPRADGSALTAAGEFRVAPGFRVVVQIVPQPGQPRAQARFTPAGTTR